MDGSPLSSFSVVEGSCTQAEEVRPGTWREGGELFPCMGGGRTTSEKWGWAPRPK